MTAHQKIHQAHLKDWAIRISEQQSSGLTIREWCTQNGLSIHKYNYWKRMLKEEVANQVLPDIVPLSLSSPVIDVTSSNIAIPKDKYRANSTIRAICTTEPTIKLCINDISLEFNPSISVEFLVTLIKAVRHA